MNTLKELKIDFEIDESLVRGLDYYTGLVFELYSLSNLGAICGGGKYASLMHDIGGPEFEGIGFSIGVERLILSLSDEQKKKFINNDKLDFFIIDLERKNRGIVIATKLRNLGYKVSFPSTSRSLNGALKMADRLNTDKVIIIDENNNTIKIKNMSTREQNEIKYVDYINQLN